MNFVKGMRFVIGYLFFAGGLLLADSGKDDFAELARIASLEGEEYLNARDQFVQSHKNNPVDLNEALGKEWSVGLMAAIINSRIIEPELYAKWDTFGLSQTRGGHFRWSSGMPLDCADPNYQNYMSNIQYYVIENIWKAKGYIWDVKDKKLYENLQSLWAKNIWPQDALDDLLEYFRRGRNYTSKKLWNKIVTDPTCNVPKLKMLANYARMEDESENTKNYFESQLKGSISSEVKKEIINGLLVRKI